MSPSGEMLAHLGYFSSFLSVIQVRSPSDIRYLKRYTIFSSFFVVVSRFSLVLVMLNFR